MHIVLEEYKRECALNNTYEQMIAMHTLRDIEDVTNLYQLARHHGMDFPEMLKNLDPSFKSDLLDKIKSIRNTAYSGESEARKEELTACLISMEQYIAQVERFRRSKQVLVFNKDFVEELIRTDDKFTIRYNIFATLPYNNFYIDLSDAKELCDNIGIDGVLMQVHSVRTMDTEFWILNCVFYKDGNSLVVISQVLPNSADDTDLTVQEIVESMAIASNIQRTVTADYHIIIPMLLNILLYLCSYEPDIHETVVSKRQRAEAKKAKKDKKDYPEQTFKVGERFGAAFRKWTKGTLGAESSTSDSTYKVKPYIRRAHWHRYWYGPRKSPDRQLRIRWVHECECAFDEDTEIEAVKHKVKK